MNKHIVLDYDLWQAINSIQALIYTPLTWEKIDSQIAACVKNIATNTLTVAIKINFIPAVVVAVKALLEA